MNHYNKFNDNYINKIFAEEINKVSLCQKGNRNNQLNESAFSLGRIIHTGLYDEATIKNALISACEQNNLISEDKNGVYNTIKSGLCAGKLEPLELKAKTSLKSNIVYPYVDENGAFLFEVERINPTKEGEKKRFFQRRYDVEHNPIYGISEGWYDKRTKNNQTFWKRISQANDKTIQPHSNAKWFEQAK